MTLVTAVLAGLFVLGSTGFGWWLNEKSQQRRDSAVTARRRSDFQRATLLELQEVMADLMRATFQIHRADRDAYLAARAANPRTARWGKAGVLPADLDERYRALNQRCNILCSRVSDEHVRELVAGLRDQMDAVVSAKNRAMADQVLHWVAELATPVQESIGVRLREVL
jgi:hypothetical protein